MGHRCTLILLSVVMLLQRLTVKNGISPLSSGLLQPKEAVFDWGGGGGGGIAHVPRR